MNELTRIATAERLYRRATQYARQEGLSLAPIPLAVPNVGILYSDHPTEISHTVYQPLFCVVLGGEKQVDFDGQRCVFSPGNGMVLSTDMPGRARISKADRQTPYVTMAVLLDRKLLRSLAHEMHLSAEIQADRAPAPRHGHAVAGAAPDDRILGLLDQIMDLLESDRPGNAAQAAALTRELHMLLLRDRKNEVLRRMACEGSQTERVADTMAYLRHNLHRHIAVEELVKMAGMSATVYHRRFKALSGTTPLQFHKRLRLLEAQRLITSGETSVAEAAFRTGYESASQFSRDYSRMFGNPPRQDRAGN